jgi:hypothetical protein
VHLWIDLEPDAGRAVEASQDRVSARACARVDDDGRWSGCDAAAKVATSWAMNHRSISGAI